MELRETAPSLSLALLDSVRDRNIRSVRSSPLRYYPSLLQPWTTISRSRALPNPERTRDALPGTRRIILVDYCGITWVHAFTRRRRRRPERSQRGGSVCNARRSRWLASQRQQGRGPRALLETTPSPGYVLARASHGGSAVRRRGRERSSDAREPGRDWRDTLIPKSVAISPRYDKYPTSVWFPPASRVERHETVAPYRPTSTTGSQLAAR